MEDIVQKVPNQSGDQRGLAASTTTGSRNSIPILGKRILNQPGAHVGKTYRRSVAHVQGSAANESFAGGVEWKKGEQISPIVWKDKSSTPIMIKEKKMGWTQARQNSALSPLDKKVRRSQEGPQNRQKKCQVSCEACSERDAHSGVDVDSLRLL